MTNLQVSESSLVDLEDDARRPEREALGVDDLPLAGDDPAGMPEILVFFPQQLLELQVRHLLRDHHFGDLLASGLEAQKRGEKHEEGQPDEKDPVRLVCLKIVEKLGDFGHERPRRLGVEIRYLHLALNVSEPDEKTIKYSTKSQKVQCVEEQVVLRGWQFSGLVGNE